MRCAVQVSWEAAAGGVGGWGMTAPVFTAWRGSIQI